MLAITCIILKLHYRAVVNPGLVEPKGPGSRGQEQWMDENVLVATYLT
jgi:hypothetical protein